VRDEPNQEVNMSSTDASSAAARETQGLGVDMALEVVTVPVSDADRAKAFYQRLGWRLDVDLPISDEVRNMQFTPPHSQCSVHVGKGVTSMEPGSLDRVILAVKDVDAARDDLIRRGIEVGEAYEQKPPGFESVEGTSYFRFASFKDPDGNGWLLQEIATRLPGREWED
jgi:catechol 2,3-dioxygenase-like lactoylglutathione lyase family enzyme